MDLLVAMSASGNEWPFGKEPSVILDAKGMQAYDCKTKKIYSFDSPDTFIDISGIKIKYSDHALLPSANDWDIECDDNLLSWFNDGRSLSEKWGKSIAMTAGFSSGLIYSIIYRVPTQDYPAGNGFVKDWVLSFFK